MSGSFCEPEILNEKHFQLEDDVVVAEEEVKVSEQVKVRECVVKEHLEGRMYSFLNVLSSTECDQLIDLLNFSTAEENVQSQIIKHAVENNLNIVRTNIRRNFIDEPIARLVWRCVKNHLPQVLPDGRKLSGVRTKMNYYRYGSGQFFSTHIDGGYRFTQTGDTSEYTFVIYMNDDFTGGSTRFCPLPEWNGTPRDVKPVKGGMLVFRQCDMKHCGVSIESGFKHILQGMIMYGPIRHNTLGQPFGKDPQLFYTTTCNCE
eukprot:TRINITY_DN1539_c5_g1_i1.p1 TRINITY_DN1539_c5_g1~~TRINITY_DN1539_c5_g1_i1.p1  ORF type:complete len:286 (-),score=55.05 TRINITY_DN1539_c5_g1_i1:37-816(-)